MVGLIVPRPWGKDVDPMSESTRRGFLKVAGAGAAAGVAAVAVGAASRSGGTAVAGTGAAAAGTAPHGSGPLVAYVRDVRGAEVSVMVGETEVVVHDADLVARLVNARSRSASTSA
jgi:hypothetical protein